MIISLSFLHIVDNKPEYFNQEQIYCLVFLHINKFRLNAVLYHGRGNEVSVLKETRI